MKKHAYLIIANKNFSQLQTLLTLLDDVRNDIYLLIDAKATSEIPVFKLNTSTLNILPQMKIYWGSYSLIEAEIRLFKSAIHVGYDYYHLISGDDLPIATQDEIHGFFDKNPNKIFLTYSNMYMKKEIAKRTKKYLFDKHFRDKDTILKHFFWSGFRKLESTILVFQKSRVSIELIDYASNWLSVDHEFAEAIIKNEKWIHHNFCGGFLVDEVFIPTLVNYLSMNSKVYYDVPVQDNFDELQGNLRYINWWQGNPYTWREDSLNDLKYAKKLGHFFSRKFDKNIDEQIIKLVVSEILKK